MVFINNYLVLTLFLVAAEQPPSLSVGDILEKECQQGNQKSCERFEILEDDLVKQGRLEKYAEAFSEKVNNNELMLDEKKPDLAAAYPLVMHDYFKQETTAGVHEILNENRLPRCAEHYHNHWINKKLWWPTTENRKPDWGSIYKFIVDHYYGFCLRQR